MRAALLMTSTVVFCAVASLANAADLVVPQKREAAVEQKAPAAELACMRWVEQTYSWYNYCDPIPYYGRNKYAWWGGPF